MTDEYQRQEFWSNSEKELFYTCNCCFDFEFKSKPLSTILKTLRKKIKAPIDEKQYISLPYLVYHKKGFVCPYCLNDSFFLSSDEIVTKTKQFLKKFKL